MPDEIERKFLVNTAVVDLQSALKKFGATNISQAYLEFGDTERRVRSDGQRFFYTIKQTKGDDPGVRDEDEKEITEEQFNQGMQNHIGSVVKKARIKIPLENGLVAEVDVYQDVLAGLITAEVEFQDKASSDAFTAPPWFGPDVTADSRYRNQSLAMHGLPKNKDNGNEWMN